LFFLKEKSLEFQHGVMLSLANCFARRILLARIQERGCSNHQFECRIFPDEQKWVFSLLVSLDTELV